MSKTIEFKVPNLQMWVSENKLIGKKFKFGTWEKETGIFYYYYRGSNQVYQIGIIPNEDLIDEENLAMFLDSDKITIVTFGSFGYNPDDPF